MGGVDPFVEETLRDLVRLQTPSDREDLREPMSEVRSLLEDLGGDVATIGPELRPVHVARFGDPEVLLLGHVDVVPPGDGWTHDPYEPVVEGDRMYGRGTSDMKAGVAAMLSPIADLGDDADALVALTSDEETTMHGAEALADHPAVQGAKIMVLPEFTDLEVGLGEKGLYQFTVTTTGTPAHGSMPHQGESAILDMIQLLEPLRGFLPLDDAEAAKSTTVNVGRIQGGLKVNVVPDRCLAEVDVRYPPGTTDDEVRQRIADVLDDTGVDYHTEEIHALPPVDAPEDHPEVQKFLEAAERGGGRHMTYASDAGRLADLGIPAILYGPGEMDTPHKPDEWVDLGKVQRAADTFRRFLEGR